MWGTILIMIGNDDGWDFILLPRAELVGTYNLKIFTQIFVGNFPSRRRPRAGAGAARKGDLLTNRFLTTAPHRRRHRSHSHFQPASLGDKWFPPLRVEWGDNRAPPLYRGRTLDVTVGIPTAWPRRAASRPPPPRRDREPQPILSDFLVPFGDKTIHIQPAIAPRACRQDSPNPATIQGHAV